jgi:ribonuclease I
MTKPRRMKWVGHVACVGDSKGAYFGEEPEGNRPLGRSRLKWEKNT